MVTGWSEDLDRPQARVLLDSESPDGVRLTTFEVTTHRFVLAEFNTHRVFSRNSASSRAIPFAKQVRNVLESPAIPVEWRAEQRGMQGGDLLSEPSAKIAERVWLIARDDAVSQARALHAGGAHKSIVNRLLEPFLWHNIIVTATEWDGFWEQRCSPLAQPEIRVAAEAMRAAYEDSVPTPIDHGEWHTPLIQPDEDTDFWAEANARMWDLQEGRWISEEADAIGEALRSPTTLRKAVSAARCARVSYLTHDGERSIEKDLDLYARLATARPGHWSPFEHVATPCPVRVSHNDFGEEVRQTSPMHTHFGNFRGWDQYRHEVSTGANA